MIVSWKSQKIFKKEHNTCKWLAGFLQEMFITYYSPVVFPTFFCIGEKLLAWLLFSPNHNSSFFYDSSNSTRKNSVYYKGALKSFLVKIKTLCSHSVLLTKTHCYVCLRSYKHVKYIPFFFFTFWDLHRLHPRQLGLQVIFIID